MSTALLLPATSDTQAVAMVVPVLLIIAIDLALIKYCLDDLSMRITLTEGDRRFWTVVIILGGPMGQIVYWLYGRGQY